MGFEQFRVGGFELGVQALVFGRQCALAEGIGNVGTQVLVVPWLGQKLVNGAFIDGIRHRLQLCVPREHDTHGVWEALARFAQKLHAGHSRHALVGDDHVHRSGCQHIQALPPALGCQDVVAIAAQQALEGVEDECLVIYQQQGWGAWFHGANHGIGFLVRGEPEEASNSQVCKLGLLGTRCVWLFR